MNGEKREKKKGGGQGRKEGKKKKKGKKTHKAQDAIDALNTLQTPHYLIKERQRLGIRPDAGTLRDMESYIRRIGYTVCHTHPLPPSTRKAQASSRPRS